MKICSQTSQKLIACCSIAGRCPPSMGDVLRLLAPAVQLGAAPGDSLPKQPLLQRRPVLHHSCIDSGKKDDRHVEHNAIDLSYRDILTDLKRMILFDLKHQRSDRRRTVGFPRVMEWHHRTCSATPNVVWGNRELLTVVRFVVAVDKYRVTHTDARKYFLLKGLLMCVIINYMRTPHFPGKIQIA